MQLIHALLCTKGHFLLLPRPHISRVLHSCAWCIQVGLIHICTFTLLLLSGERNFCVALNQPFTSKLPADLPLFTGSHVDLLIIVLHKLGTCCTTLPVPASACCCPHRHREPPCRHERCLADLLPWPLQL